MVVSLLQSLVWDSNASRVARSHQTAKLPDLQVQEDLPSKTQGGVCRVSTPLTDTGFYVITHHSL